MTAAAAEHPHHGATPLASHNVITTGVVAAVYVISGVCQPLIMQVCRQIGLAHDPVAQLYMVAYYAGPAVLGMCATRLVPSQRTVATQSVAIAVLDLMAQACNYTGAAWAGPTLFAIIYASVTVWTALGSWLLLGRALTCWQWGSIWLVFVGLTLTTMDAAAVPHDNSHYVWKGTLLVLVGSVAHGTTYVLSEAVLAHTTVRLTILQNAYIQGATAGSVLILWQLVYTVPHWRTSIAGPVQRANTSVATAGAALAAFAVANLIHSASFMHTLAHFVGGATSAGVLKGLQAVLVFGATDVLFCHDHHRTELCFSTGKLASLITVVAGIASFGAATDVARRQEQRKMAGYTAVSNSAATTDET